MNDNATACDIDNPVLLKSRARIKAGFGLEVKPQR
jgi:hypothetical protein